MSTKKRGQTTVFIIVGLILLLSTGLYFVVRHNLSSTEDILTEETKPIKEFVEACLKRSLTDGIVKIGNRGGFLNYSPDIMLDPASRVQLLPSSDFFIPLWYYNKRSFVPPLQEYESTDYSIASQISNFVSSDISSCLENYTNFTYKFEITETSRAVLNTVVSDKSVDAKLRLPLKIVEKGTGREFKLTNFNANVNVKLKEIYELANKILTDENSKMFLENTLLDLMVIDRAIPFTDIEFGKCDRLEWSKSKITKEVQDILYTNLPRIRVNNTDYQPFGFGEEYERLHYLWHVSDQDFSSLRTMFYYDKTWPITLNVRPSEGDALYSNFGEGDAKYIMKSLCINMYHFSYDIETPVSTVIYDKTAFENTGFQFRFAFPLILDHNTPAKSQPVYSQFFTPSYKEGFCSKKTDKVYRIMAVDSETGEDLKDVNVSFTCLVYRCDLGQTKNNAGSYELITRLPSSCNIGTLTLEKEGYNKKEYRVTFSEESEDLVIDIDRLHDINIEVFKRAVNDLNKDILLDEKENVIIKLLSNDEKYSVLIDYPRETKLKALYKTQDYTLKLFLLENETYKGGYSANLTLSYQDIVESDKITFYVLENKSVSSEDVSSIFSLINSEFEDEKLKPKIR